MEDREVLKKYGFGFKKKLGQNFLTDKNLLAAIAEDAGVNGGTVVEIGAGAGALTRALAARAARVVAFEIDKSLKPVLAETLSGIENAEVIFADFSSCDLSVLEAELGTYQVVANLPYYITTPIVMKLVEEAASCSSITVMVQEEVARRFTAKAGTAEYGAVTAAIALYGTCELMRKVPRTLFYPQPNVDSAVVKIARGATISPMDRRAYRAAVRCAFASRRKTLENNLMASFHLTRAAAQDILAAAGIPQGVRGETLTPAELCLLSDKIFQNNLIF